MTDDKCQECWLWNGVTVSNDNNNTNNEDYFCSAPMAFIK